MKINEKSIKMEDVRAYDYPDFSDAYIGYAEYEDGTPLEHEDLDELNEDGELVNRKAYETFINYQDEDRERQPRR